MTALISVLGALRGNAHHNEERGHPMGTALTGLLQGFTETSLKLKEQDEKRQREQAELEFKKEDLALRRKILQGEEAARTLRMRKDELDILSLTRDLNDYVGAHNLLRQARHRHAPGSRQRNSSAARKASRKHGKTMRAS